MGSALLGGYFWINWVNQINYTTATFCTFCILHCSSLAVTLVLIVASDSTSTLPTSKEKKNPEIPVLPARGLWETQGLSATCGWWYFKQPKNLPFILRSRRRFAQLVQLFKHLSEILICHVAGEHVGGAFHSLEKALRTKVESLGTLKCKSFFPGNSTALNSLEK